MCLLIFLQLLKIIIKSKISEKNMYSYYVVDNRNNTCNILGNLFKGRSLIYIKIKYCWVKA